MDNTTENETLNNSEATSAPVDNTQDVNPIETTPAETTVQDEVSTTDAKNSTDTSAVGDKDANKRATLLDVVKAAYEGKPDSDSSAEEDKTVSADVKNTETQGNQDDSQAPKDVSQKPADKVPFHNHPRWKEMITERDALKPKAEQFEKITKFMQDSGLSSQEMADGMQVMAMMKTDPQEAYKALQAYVNQLAPLVGEVLPEDIKQKVEDGFIDADTAKDYARLKAQQDYNLQRQAEATQRNEANQSAANQRAMHDAVAQWESTEKAKDPDWSVKYDMVMDRVKSLLTTERPSTPSEAIKIASRALSDVNVRLRPYAGRNVPIKNPTSSLSSTNSRPVPRTLHDVVLANLNQ
jgi:hypothetical protein